jgi:nucleotide-binding universal stress UspA family protein
MKILLAIDGSEFSEAAVRMVAASNRAEGTEVRVLHVVEPLASLFQSLGAGPGYYPPAAIDWDRFQKDQLEKGRELVTKAAEKLRSSGFRVEAMVREGPTRTEIVDIASQWHADLIVVGSHGRRGLQRMLLGSVSDFVARHATCSVEIARMPPA